MSSTNDIVARRRAELPASIIFSPREFKQYRRWQLQTQSYFDSDSIGHLPSALEYCAYKSWRNEQSRVDLLPDPFRWGDELAAHMSPAATPHSVPPSPPLSECGSGDTATVCGHIIHPSTSEKEQERCPPCIMQAHLKYMAVLTESLESVGGPRLPRASKDSRNTHQLTYEAWYCGKLDLVQAVYNMQNWALQENDYPIESFEEDLASSRTAQEALSMYWETVEHATTIFQPETNQTEKQKEAEIEPIKRRDSSPSKKVHFAADTCFTEGRAQAYYRKDGPRYEPKFSATAIENGEEMDGEGDGEGGEQDEEVDGDFESLDGTSSMCITQDEDFIDDLSEEDYNDDDHSTIADDDDDWCDVVDDYELTEQDACDASFIIFE